MRHHKDSKTVWLIGRISQRTGEISEFADDDDYTPSAVRATLFPTRGDAEADWKHNGQSADERIVKATMTVEVEV